LLDSGVALRARNAPRSPTMGDLIARVDLEVHVLETLVGFGLLKRRSVGRTQRAGRVYG
jgi:hypothetical protein